MDTVTADAALEDLGLRLRAGRPSDPAEPKADVAAEDLLAQLGD